MRLRVPVTSVLTAALLVPTGALASEEPAPEPAPDPMAGAPAVGECSTMTFEDAVGRSAPDLQVPCKGRHTTVVTGVGQLPEDVTWDQDGEVYAAVQEACDPGWQAVTSVDHLLYRQSAYQEFWFYPTAEQRDAGARWFRCDLARVQGADLLTTRGETLPKVKPRLHDTVRRCMDASYRGTVCFARDAVWRSKSAYWLRVPKRDARARKVVYRSALERCPEYSRSGSFAWQWFADEERRWVVVCFDDRV